MKREYLDYLSDMIEAMDNAVDFVKGISFKKFERDNKTIYAVIRAIEIMGEAAKNVPANIRDRYPDIPWKAVAGMRDKLIHEYFGAKLDVVWETVIERMPELRTKLKQVFKQLKKER